MRSITHPVFEHAGQAGNAAVARILPPGLNIRLDLLALVSLLALLIIGRGAGTG